MIDILLPVYNGEKYLRQQLDSILSQSYRDWRILIRDDGSKVGSLIVAKEYESRYKGNIIVLEDNDGNLGLSECLNRLLAFSSSEYFMFCDQDDIWETDKIEISMKEMKRLEQDAPGKPLLVCSDSSCVDDNNRLIAPSFFENQRFVDTTDDVHKMLALNIVQGSTMLMNKMVKSVVWSLPNSVYHDWWTAVNVVYYGKVSYIHTPLLRYRQHQDNVVGALSVGPGYLLGKLAKFRKQWFIYRNMYSSLKFKPSIIKWAYYKFIFNIRRFK